MQTFTVCVCVCQNVCMHDVCQDMQIPCTHYFAIIVFIININLLKVPAVTASSLAMDCFEHRTNQCITEELRITSGILLNFILKSKN